MQIEPNAMDDRQLREVIDDCGFDCPEYEAILAEIERRNLDI
jgi:hypothetical protein